MELFHTQVIDEWETLEAIEDYLRTLTEPEGQPLKVSAGDTHGPVSGESLAAVRAELRAPMEALIIEGGGCEVRIERGFENTIDAKNLPTDEADEVVDTILGLVAPVEAAQAEKRRAKQLEEELRQAAANRLHRRAGRWIRHHANDLAVNALVGSIFFVLGLLVAC